MHFNEDIHSQLLTRIDSSGNVLGKFVLLLCLALIACQPEMNHPPSISSLPTAAATAEKDIPSFQPIKIAAGQIHEDMGWSPNSQILYYGVNGQILAYNLQDGTTIEASEEVMLTRRAESEPNPYLSPRFSPSGNRAVSLQLPPDTSPTLTPDPRIEGGESLDIRRELEVWLWEEDSSRRLGLVEQCALWEDFWSPDEDKVVLLESAIPMPVCEDTNTLVQAWLFNLTLSTITPLFPREEYPPVQIYGFSPDGQQLLHGFYTDISGANLRLLDIEQFTSTPVNAPVSDVVQWLNDRELLVKYRRDPEGFTNTIGVLDIHTSEFTELTPVSPELYISYASLSPDEKWLAFTTGSGHFEQTDLWLTEVGLQ